MESWMISWGLALAAGGGLYVYYASTGKPKITQQKPLDISDFTEKSTPAPEKRKQPKSVLKKEASPAPKSKASGTDSKDAKKRSGHQKTSSVSFTQDTAEAAEDDDEDIAQDDKEWARQLDAAKKGVNLNAQTQSNKAKKQNKKKQAAAEDRSHENGAATAGSVADMLEPTPAGPSSIRITGEEKPKKAQAAKAAPQQETKKQRQNRRKVEEAKAQREADEQERKKLEEQQRRSAREARGEPARNGVSVAPASNAWAGKSSAPQTNGSGSAPSQAPLLDTFEPVQAVKAVDVGVNGSASAIQTNAVDASQLSEEKQIELIQEMSGWNEVPAKKSKKTKKDAESSTTNSPPPEAASAPAEVAAPTKAANKFATASTNELVGGKKNLASKNVYAALEEATSFTSGPKGHPQDSDWAAN